MYKMDGKTEDEDGDGINTGFFLDIGQRDRKSRGGYNIDQMVSLSPAPPSLWGVREDMQLGA